MKKIVVLMTMVCIFGGFAHKTMAQNNNTKTTNEKESVVYFTKDISPEGVMKIYNYIKSNVKGKVGIKIHFGEDGNQYRLPANLVKPLCKATNGTLVETNVAYTGRRGKTATHIQLAKDHGYTFAPIDILDAGGELNAPVKNGNNFKTAKLGKNIDKYETIIYFTHFKGHGSAGIGGSIKNASMGMATPNGKKEMHGKFFPVVDTTKCVACRRCVENCPAGAITLHPLAIDKTKCIGCAKCVSTCPNGAIRNPEDKETTRVFLERLVEYAEAAIDERHSVYINIIMNVSPTCDCGNHPKPPFVENIGIVASTDIVAADKAAYDLVNKAKNSKDAFLDVEGVSGMYQLEYAEKLGMGTRNYKLIDIDKK
jgi:uncharacterized Fe-S center protein